MMEFFTDNALWIALGIAWAAIVAGLLALNHAAHRHDSDDEVRP